MQIERDLAHVVKILNRVLDNFPAALTTEDSNALMLARTHTQGVYDRFLSARTGVEASCAPPLPDLGEDTWDV